MKTEEQIHNECLDKVRVKLKEITDPVCGRYSSKSYNALADVISNVILFEINIDKKPFEEIPKKEIALKTKEEVWAEFLDGIYLDGKVKKVTVTKLLEVVKESCSYHDHSADQFSEEDLIKFQLFIALKNYQKIVE